MRVIAAVWIFSYGVGALSCGNNADDPISEECRKFKEFEDKFVKKYANEKERLEHFEIFVLNLIRIEAIALQDPLAHYSHLTPLADMSAGEFSSRNTLQKQKNALRKKTLQLDTSTTPSTYDWRDKGGVNPVQDQGQCGSCWAFATVANIEGVYFNQHKKLVKLSEQELVSCDHNGDQGCAGGLPSQAADWLINEKTGLVSEDDYPYTADDSPCSLESEKAIVWVNAWSPISTNEDQIAAALVQYGPLSIGINANVMQFYFGGVSAPPAIICDPTKLDHGVDIVGFNVDPTAGPYWIIRNHWGSTWGEQGYYWAARGKGVCGLNTMVTTVTRTSDHAENEDSEAIFVA
eukprot:GEMP01029715.1.p1 GENE.GEMP01029715.1~~GEMP01029715.1.p1  ORF type:complete len:348 (+),score=74.01 GEMP01029715.1:57-1100(+)